MRQGQQNRRGRGRNRKNQNPLTRSFESSGPDVKIRGTPSHIAEKYMSMARDALASGDPVLAENYLQHAEHYNRIIMSYREQQTPVGEGAGAGNGRNRLHDSGEQPDVDEISEADEPAPGQEPQPVIAGDEIGAEEQEERPERAVRRGNGARGMGRRRRHEPRENGHAGHGGDDEELVQDAGPARTNRRKDAFVDDEEQPNFLKRPVRRPRRGQANEAKDDNAADDGQTADEAAE